MRFFFAQDNRSYGQADQCLCCLRETKSSFLPTKFICQGIAFAFLFTFIYAFISVFDFHEFCEKALIGSHIKFNSAILISQRN